MAEQNLGNHTKFVPSFHFFVLPILLLNFIWSIRMWVKAGFSYNGLVAVLFALAVAVFAVCARLFATKVQDRVIRLEERLRYERLLPAELKPRIGEFTVNQLVSLRFASDAELPGLARKVLEDKMDGRKAIKQLIKNWKPDYLRA
jgi:uncharacterized membrane protein YciS (DUF1049 family)